MITETIDEYKFTKKDLVSVIKIQSLWRGYRVRRNFLSIIPYKQAIQFIKQCSDFRNVPKASTGITTVYLPPHLPVVLKALGKARSQNRFFTMWKARDLLAKSSYTRLVIPQARPHKEYNIENRLPVDSVNQRSQIALYEENQGFFSQAVMEFTGFICQCILPDILTYTHPYLKSDKIPLVRCDNLPLLIDQNKGLIALIDLGGLQVRSCALSLNEATECAKTAIFIFPYHFTDILKVVGSFCKEIYSRFEDLQEIQKKTVLQFKNIYANHHQFILKKNQSHALSIFHKQNELDQKIQFLITEITNTNLLNKKTLLLFKKHIYEPIAEKLLENHITPSLDYNIRMITLDCESIFKMFQSENDLINAKKILQLILNQLTSKDEICYSNIYLNRHKTQQLRIHL